MSRLKVLQLQNWMKPREPIRLSGRIRDIREETLRHYRPWTEEKIGRAGVYQKGSRQTWFELEDGRAFEYRKEAFDFDLGLLAGKEIPKAERAALIAIAKTRFATRKQRKLAHFISLADDDRRRTLDFFKRRKAVEAFLKRPGVQVEEM